MKYLIITMCLLLTFSFSACNNSVDNVINPPIEIVTPILPETEENDGQDNDKNPSIDQDEEERKKKSYIVSKVDGLRVRKGTNGASAVIGKLDKNDAVVFIGEENDYYQTVYKEQTAFIYKDYCTIMEVESSDPQSELAIDFGHTLLGYPYVWGSQRYHWGNGKLNKNFVNGEFDCSALVQYIYYISNDVILDVTTRTQVYNGKEVQKNELKRGDLMFFTNQSRQDKTGAERIGHVGIYFGNNYILHTASDHAVIEPISNTRWGYYVCARRVV